MKRSPAQPELLPVLSPGKHRNPRKGACFMEFASYLAGERWSDHPPCRPGAPRADGERLHDQYRAKPAGSDYPLRDRAHECESEARQRARRTSRGSGYSGRSRRAAACTGGSVHRRWERWSVSAGWNGWATRGRWTLPDCWGRRSSRRRLPSGGRATSLRRISAATRRHRPCGTATRSSPSRSMVAPAPASVMPTIGCTGCCLRPSMTVRPSPAWILRHDRRGPPGTPWRGEWRASEHDRPGLPRACCAVAMIPARPLRSSMRTQND